MTDDKTPPPENVASTLKKPTDSSGDRKDGSGEDTKGGKDSPQQVHSDEDQG